MELLRSSKSGFLHDQQWLRVIIDEGHCIKNANSETNRVAKSLHALYKWIVTGKSVNFNQF